MITKFDSQFGFNSPFGYGGQVSYSPTNKMKVGLSYSNSSVKKQFDSVGSLDVLNISTSIYRFQLQYRIINVSQSWRLFLNAGFGVITFKTPERQVDLGGLGQMTMPEKTDSGKLYSGGITITKNLSQRVFMQLIPEVFIFKNSGEVKTNFNLAGGIGFGLF
jgi:hypothetical protein